MTSKNLILVVEDEKPLLKAIKIKLEKTGFKVLTARSVKEAIDALSQEPKITAIWLDHYLLGSETGLDFVAKCKTKNSPCNHVPIFVVSNTVSQENIYAYLKFDSVKYYIKANQRLEDVIAEIKATI